MYEIYNVAKSKINKYELHKIPVRPPESNDLGGSEDSLSGLDRLFRHVMEDQVHELSGREMLGQRVRRDSIASSVSMYSLSVLCFVRLSS